MPHSQHIGERYKDVTSVNWSPDGKHLATGCYDGVARVWTALGHLEMELHDHSGPVFSLKWSKDGQYLLSGSYDRRSIIWNPVTGKAVKTYLLHSAPVLDVDWSDSDLFATCSSDRTIYICKVSTPESTALCTFVGHDDEVNSVSWSPGGQYLASCSDDSTAKVVLLLRNFLTHWLDMDCGTRTSSWSSRPSERNLYCSLDSNWTRISSSRCSSSSLYCLFWWICQGNTFVLIFGNFFGRCGVQTQEPWYLIWHVMVNQCTVYQRILKVDTILSTIIKFVGKVLAAGSLGGHVTLWSLEDGSLVSRCLIAL